MPTHVSQPFFYDDFFYKDTTLVLILEHSWLYVFEIVECPLIISNRNLYR